MLRFVVLAALAAVAAAQSGQYVKGQDAAILSEARYLSGDGKFGAAYVQEDGIEFKEETDADGTRHGSYSYVDPDGKRRTISYTAGKGGFKATGDHIPVAAPAPLPVAPKPQYVPQEQYQARDQQSWNQQPAAPAPQWNNAQASDVLWNVKPEERSWYQPQQQQWAAQAQPQQQWSAPAQPQQQQWAAPAQPQQQQWSQNAIPDYTTTTTPGPVRHFHPPGKLSLSRSNDGYSYTFNKN